MKLTPTRNQQQNNHHHHQNQLNLQSPSQFQYLQSQQFPLTPMPTERGGGVKIFTFLQGVNNVNTCNNTTNSSSSKRAPSMTQYQIINLNHPHKNTSTFMKPLQQQPSTPTVSNPNMLNSNPNDILESQEPQQGLQKTATFSGLSQLQGLSHNKHTSNNIDCLSNPTKLSITPRKANTKLFEKTITSPFFSSNKQQQQGQLSQQIDNYPKINPFLVNQRAPQPQQHQQFNSSFYNFFSQNQLQNDVELAQKQQTHQMLIQHHQQQQQKQSSSQHFSNGQQSYSSTIIANQNQQQYNYHSNPISKGTSSSCDKSVSSKVSSSQSSAQQPILDKNIFNKFLVSGENNTKNPSCSSTNISINNNNYNKQYFTTNDISMNSQHQIKKCQQPQLSNINKQSEWQQQTQFTINSQNPSSTPRNKGNNGDVIYQKQEQQQQQQQQQQLLSYKSQNLILQKNQKFQQQQQQSSSVPPNANQQQQQQYGQIATSSISQQQPKQELHQIKNNISCSNSSKKPKLQSQALEEAIQNKQRCASQNNPSTPSSNISNALFHKTNINNTHAAFLKLNKDNNNVLHNDENNTMISNQLVSHPKNNLQDSSHNKKSQHRPQLLLSASAITPFIQNFVETGMSNRSTTTTPTNIIFIDKHVGSITTTIVNSNKEGNNNLNKQDILNGRVIYNKETNEPASFDNETFKFTSVGAKTKNSIIKCNFNNLDGVNQTGNNLSNSNTKKTINNSLKKRKCCSVEKSRNTTLNQRQLEMQQRRSEKLNGVSDKEEQEEEENNEINDYTCQPTKWEQCLEKSFKHVSENCIKNNADSTKLVAIAQDKSNSLQRETNIQLNVQSEGNQKQHFSEVSQQQNEQISVNMKQSLDKLYQDQIQIQKEFQRIQQHQDILNQREVQLNSKECQLREIERALEIKEKQVSSQQTLNDMIKHKLANIELSVEQLQANSLRLNEERNRLEEKLSQANNTVSIYQQLNNDMKKQKGGEVHESISLAITLVQKLSDELSVTRQQQIQAIIERDQAIKDRDKAIKERDQQFAQLKNDRNQRLLERQSISMLRNVQPDESFVVTLEIPTENDILSEEQQQQQQQFVYVSGYEQSQQQSIEICQQRLQNSQCINEDGNNVEDNNEIIEQLHDDKGFKGEINQKDRINQEQRMGQDYHSTLESLITHQQQQQLAYQKLTESINKTLTRQVQQKQSAQSQLEQLEQKVQINQPINQSKVLLEDQKQLKMQQKAEINNSYLSQILSLNQIIPQNCQSTNNSNNSDEKQSF